ncbi:MAG: isocitrate/isopropylmalate family dehydrogenase [Photobacterium halotolerans]
MENKKVLVLPGDGIGVDVCNAALPIFDVLALPIELSFGDIGWSCWENEGTPIPVRTWDQITKSDAVLLGAITSKGKDEAEKALPKELQNKNWQYVSPVIQLRQKLGLFANIRPAYYINGDREPFDLCVIRENTEGLYAGFDFKGIPENLDNFLTHPNIDVYGSKEAAWSVRLQTKHGLSRLFKKAFSYAEEHGLKRVTFADKPNVMRESGKFAKDIFFDFASHYPDITADIHNVDAVALWLVKKPHEFGVIVAENMFGDILSDLAAGVMGGLGVAPSANIGSDIAYFEPVHGSAPKIAGKGKANPCALFMSIALMLDYLGYPDHASRLQDAVKYVIKSRVALSYDFGGDATTVEVSQAIIDAYRDQTEGRTVAILTIGDELLSGKSINTNLSDLSQIAKHKGYSVVRQIVCSDSVIDIKQSISKLAGDVDYLVVSGGLGPTSDDRTRFAVAEVAKESLVFNEDSWKYIESRLTNFNVTVDESNRVQAMFPETAAILSNPNGTANGFSLNIYGTKVLVLPGPPGEAKYLLEKYLTETVNASTSTNSYKWSIIGVSEGEVGTFFETTLKKYDLKLHFLWEYPYVQVEAIHPKGHTVADSTLQAIRKKFGKLLISESGEKASEIVSRQNVGINWESNGDSVSKKISNELSTITNRKNINKTIHFWVYPSLIELLENKNFTGVCWLFCNDDNGNIDSISFPCRGSEIQVFIKEYLCNFAIRLSENYIKDAAC